MEEPTVLPATTSEAAAMASVLEWSGKCPDWQKDALRRIYLNGKLREEDIRELYEISKGNAPAVALNQAHLKDVGSVTAAVTLRRLHELKGVNALVEGEALVFGKSGMTVIYGDNGAGKSGYARVLKHLCRARKAQGETILPDVHAATAPPPSASIDFAVGEQNQKAQWTLGSAPDARLSAVSVFDSSTANIHVDGANNLAYTPVALEILATLAETCRTLDHLYDQDISRLQAQTPALLKSPTCTTSTEVGRLIYGLSFKSDKIKLASLAQLSPEQSARLETLNRELAKDPQTLSQQLQTRKRRIEKEIETLNNLASAVSPERSTALAQASRELTAAKDAVRVASNSLFSNLPLPDVGSDVWRALWSAARNYSQLHAYKSKDFPVVEEDAHCPLCQQTLSPEAKERFLSFESFVKGESEKQEARAQLAYNQALQAIKGNLPSVRRLPDSVTWYRDDLELPELASKLRKVFVQTLWRARAMIRSVNVPGVPSPPPVGYMPLEELTALAATTGQTIAALTTESESPQRKALIAERDGLADMKWLSVALTDVEQQVDRLKAIDNLQTLAKQTLTTRISALTTTLARAHVTDHLKSCFDTEVKSLGIAALGVELRQGRTVAGVPQFQVRLNVETRHPLGKVLSEGEHRCVALAAFLAELTTTNVRSAIVFDDPVSSLDQIHREAVARRLAAESLKRQVIILTHDVAFLLLLEEACHEIKAQVTYRLISRGENAPGYCNEAPPNDALPIDSVLSKLTAHLGNVSNLYVRGNSSGWELQVKTFQVELRMAWERAVEEAVKPVLRRLGRKVDTTGLIQLSVLTPKDHHDVRDAFGRISMLLHSQPTGLTPALPAPATIEREIIELSSWLDSIRQRQKAAA